jgi:hypothetical protein
MPMNPRRHSLSGLIKNSGDTKRREVVSKQRHQIIEDELILQSNLPDGSSVQSTVS